MFARAFCVTVTSQYCDQFTRTPWFGLVAQSLSVGRMGIGRLGVDTHTVFCRPGSFQPLGAE